MGWALSPCPLCCRCRLRLRFCCASSSSSAGGPVAVDLLRRGPKGEREGARRLSAQPSFLSPTQQAPRRRRCVRSFARSLAPCRLPFSCPMSMFMPCPYPRPAVVSAMFIHAFQGCHHVALATARTSPSCVRPTHTRSPPATSSSTTTTTTAAPPTQQPSAAGCCCTHVRACLPF